MTMNCFLVREKPEQSFAWLPLYSCADRYPSIYITVLFAFIHSSALLNITMQLKAAAVSLCCYKHINGLVDFSHPSLPLLTLFVPMADENDPWLKMLIALLDASTTVKVNAWPGSQQAKGRVGRIGKGQGCVLYQHHPGSPKSLHDPRETCAARNIPVIQPYLWVAEGVLQVVQVVPCPPGLVSCLQRYPVTGAFLKADIVVLRCALPQSWLRSGFLRHGLWALHASTLPHAQL